MLGKIFSESDSIYHDQAKVLLDYYSAAAEKIVAEEERIEKQIAILEEEKAMLQKQIDGLWVWFLTLIFFFVYYIKKIPLKKKLLTKKYVLLSSRNNIAKSLEITK